MSLFAGKILQPGIPKSLLTARTELLHSANEDFEDSLPKPVVSGGARYDVFPVGLGHKISLDEKL